MTEYSQAQIATEAKRAARLDCIRRGVKLALNAAPTWKIRIHASGRIQLAVSYHDTLGNPGKTSAAI